jgi:hypothetical protein
MLDFFLDSSFVVALICTAGAALAIGYFVIRLPRDAVTLAEPAPVAE